MLFSRSFVLYWMEALRSNGVEMTRSKRQKEQREIFVASEQQIMSHQKASENSATKCTNLQNQLKQPSRASFSSSESIRIRVLVNQFSLMWKLIT
jgi:hypothetical protein